jgi:crotonobetainyl-CoA:carnitine CoA-transferase CaiB-like acyl-CoA transferase
MSPTEVPQNSIVSSEALAGVRVLDFTHTLAGPFCTQMMADAGATVIKVEPPGGEFSRIRGAKRVGPNGTEVSTYSGSVNRGKRSIVIDLKSEAGLELAKRLADRCDVMVENFAPGTIQRLGLDPSELRKRNPRLVTASISLFGGYEKAGDLAARGGLAIVAEAEATITDGMRLEDGVPQLLRFPLGDMGTGLAAYAAIVTALVERERTGRGGHADLTMVGTLMALNSVALVRAQILATNGSDLATQHNAVYGTWTAGAGIFKTKEDYIVIAVNTDTLFHRLARAMDREEWITDERYGSFREREKRVEEVNDMVNEWTSQQPTDEIVRLCIENKIPVGRIQSAGDLIESEEIKRLNLMPEIDDGSGLTLRAPASPTGLGQENPALPRLDQHRDQVLTEILEADRGEIDALAEAGAFGS